MTLTEQFREAFAVCWEAVKRRPVLAWLPFLLWMKFFERDTLHKWFDEAEQAVQQRRNT